VTLGFFEKDILRGGHRVKESRLIKTVDPFVALCPNQTLLSFRHVSTGC